MKKLLAPLAIFLALVGAGCASTQAEGPGEALNAAIAGDWRKPEDAARDQWRHPAETLAFFGLRPGVTLVEINPGGGWYTDILAPYARMTDGAYVYTHGNPERMNDQQKAGLAATKARFGNEAVYGKIEYAVFARDNASACEPGTADVVVTFRNVHNWMAAGWADQAFKQMAACLKPGGTLGVVEHRMPASREMDARAPTGYVHEAAVKKFAADAGLVFEASSEVNANPKDTADHPYGVWTLPPNRRGPVAGQEPAAGYDRAKYDAIGESDRMTLRFKKPS